MEQNHDRELVKDLESQKFEQVGENFKCRDCGEDEKKHTIICPVEPAEEKSPQKKQCFKCQGIVIRQYVLAKKKHSQKNDWGYWTEKEENKGKYICNFCLLNLYHNDKYQYLREVQVEKKRKLLRVYVCNKIIR